MNNVNDSLNPTGIFTSLSQNIDLTRQLIKREIISRYRGSVMGFFWTMLTPLMMLAIYTFIFGYVFDVRRGNSEMPDGLFAVNLFCGLIVHGFFAEGINRAPTLITGNVNYVKKVVFPIEIFPWVTVGATLFNSMMSFTVLCLFNLAVTGSIPVTIIWLPVVLLPFVLLMTGAIWLFSALGVYLSDIKQLMGMLTTALLFLSPIFYPISALPPALQSVIYLNPLALIIEQCRDVLLWGKLPNFTALAVYFIVALVVAVIGFTWFQKSRRGFADVL
ncbi:MAG TPA: sugar ABC transporter permease [Gammaproteobacteria bacterium]|nr:sugar ABC transporter permease [Gammaproteobacteria bacterium]